jgi:hypothetical protein
MNFQKVAENNIDDDLVGQQLVPLSVCQSMQNVKNAFDPPFEERAIYTRSKYLFKFNNFASTSATKFKILLVFIFHKKGKWVVGGKGYSKGKIGGRAIKKKLDL